MKPQQAPHVNVEFMICLYTTVGAGTESTDVVGFVEYDSAKRELQLLKAR